MTQNGWLRILEENPGHSDWYVERFRTMEADGADLGGEARFVDAMVARGSRVLDAGCGPGRVGGRLARLGHDVVGVDIDPALIVAAEADHPGPVWLTADLATLDLAQSEIESDFDAIVCAGNVMTFLDPATRRNVLERLADHLAPGGRIAIGFGNERGYDFEEFFDDVDTVGLRVDLRLSSWDLRPFESGDDFVVAVLSRQSAS